MVPTGSVRHNWATVAAIGIVAGVSADMVHEALGHGIAAWLTGDRILSLCTVALQNATANRFVSAAGTSANCLVGAGALLLLRRAESLKAWSYFLWIFGAFNLFNAGYLVCSAVTNSGDWANVIAGLSPVWLWRGVLALLGTALYVSSIRWTAGSMIRLVGSGNVVLPNMWRLILPAYLAAGAVMTIASVFNPISPSLILPSGAGASFGLNAGLLFLPGIIAGDASGTQGAAARAMPFSFLWLALAVVFAGIFIVVLGPGIRFGN